MLFVKQKEIETQAQLQICSANGCRFFEQASFSGESGRGSLLDAPSGSHTKSALPLLILPTLISGGLVISLLEH